MGRLLNWPRNIGLTKMQPLSGPRSVGATSNESINGYVQTVASAFGLWKWQFTVQFSRGKGLRALRGLLTSLHGGANAVRFTFADPDRDLTDSGLSSNTDRVTWGNGLPWANGCWWSVSPPLVSVAASAAIATDTVTLADEKWVPDLDVGDWIGFVPFHFGLYVITEVISETSFRIWPPLDKALTTSSYATLRPVMVMRLQGEDGAVWSRDPNGASDTMLTFIQVQDTDARDYFTDSYGVPRNPTALLLGDSTPLLFDDDSYVRLGS